MKKASKVFLVTFLTILFVIGLGLGLWLGSKARTVSNGEHIITVCTTTDIHGAYFDGSYDSPDEHNRTSMSKVSTYIKSLRKNGEGPILIDVGDALQGDDAAYYYNYVDTTDEHVFASIAKYLKYDALVVGNHDIEAGPSVYNRMRGTFKDSYLGANAISIEGPSAGHSYFNPCKIVKRDGLKIAIIGLTNANIKNWLAEDKWKGLDFVVTSSIMSVLLEDVHAVYHPDIIILAMHSGMGREFPAIENEACFVASDNSGINLVLCGHDHKAACVVVQDVYGENVTVMDAGTKAANVGKAVMHVNVVDHKVTSVTVTHELVSMENIEPDPAFNKKFEKQYKKVFEFANTPVAEIEDNIYFSEAIDGPSAYINLIHQVQLKESGADISFAAPLSGASDTVHKGMLAFKDLTKIYKFENQLFVVKMTGQQIKDYLEFSYDNWINGTSAPFNYDSADGIRYEVDRKAAKGSRINIISMCDGSAFDFDKTYKVAMTSYRASGGGNLLRSGAGIAPSDLEIVGKYDDIRSLIGNWFREQGTVTPSVATNWKWAD